MALLTDKAAFQKAIEDMPATNAGKDAGRVDLRLFKEYWKYVFLTPNKHLLNKYRTDGPGGRAKGMPYDSLSGSKEQIISFISKN